MKLNFGKTQNQVDWRFNQMNAYQKDLFDIKDTLNSSYDSLEEAKKAIKPLLLKLNNPTFYSKHIYSKPTEQYGFGNKNYSKNFLTRFTADCIKIINESQDLYEMLKRLQTEYSWTLNKDLTHWLKNA
jgi:hypothetical protein